MSAALGGLALLIFVALIVQVTRRRPPTPLWPSLPVVYVSSLLWVLGNLALTRSSISPVEDWFWTVVLYTGVLFLFPAWWILSFRFEEHLRLRAKSVHWAVAHAPTVIATFHFVLLITNPLHGLFIEAQPGERNEYRLFWYTQNAFAFGLVFWVVFRYLGMRRRLSRADLRSQLTVMIVASIVPMPFNLIYTAGLVDPGIDTTVIGAAISGLLFYAGIYRFRLFTLGAARMDQLLDHSAEALLLLDPAGRISEVNRTTIELLGAEACRPGEDAVGHLMGLIPATMRSEEGEQLRSMMASVQTGGADHEEARFRFEHPRIRHGLVRITSLRNAENALLGLGMEVQDLTALVETRAQLDLVEEAFLRFLEIMPDPVLIHRQGTMRYANRAASEFLGRRVEDILTLQGIDLLHPSERAGALERQSRIESGQAGELREIAYLRPDGSSIHGEVRTVPTTFGGQPNVLVTVRDLTERRKAEEERRSLEALAQKRERIESLGVFAGGVAHDFNNLLMGISGNIELVLQDTALSERARRNLQRSMEGVERAAELVRQILIYVGAGSFARVPISLSTLVHRSLQLLASRIGNNTQIVFAPSLDPELWGDAGQIEHMIRALLSNSIEALGEKGGTIEIRLNARTLGEEDLRSPFVLETPPGGEYATLEIRDTGCGIQESHMSKLFEPFFSTRFMGRGLGLSAALGIVRAHGGTIQVESEEGKGSTFRVFLPTGTIVGGRSRSRG